VVVEVLNTFDVMLVRAEAGFRRPTLAGCR
jgi:hypothetical protein